MSNKLSKYYLFSFWLLLLGSLNAQYDTTHYIPYLTDLTGNKKLASLERNASVYNGNTLASRPTTGGEGSGGAYIMFSTFEPGPFYVRIYKRNSSGTDWQQMKAISISPGSPHTWKLSFGETEEFFRYPMYFESIPTKNKAKKKFLNKFNSGLPSNRQISESTPNPIDYRYSTSWLNTDDHGLKIVADKNIYVRVVLKNDTDEYRDKYNYKYGEGTNTHGSAFSSKGIGRGAGTEFYTAHFYSQSKISKPGDQDFISVMSLEDGNTITLDSQRAWSTPYGSNTVTLDEGESVIFKRSWTNSNYSLGTRIYSTNDKEMVVTSGSWGGRLKDNEPGDQDIGIEQLVPVKALGKKYLISQSKTPIST